MAFFQWHVQENTILRLPMEREMKTGDGILEAIRQYVKVWVLFLCAFSCRSPFAHVWLPLFVQDKKLMPAPKSENEFWKQTCFALYLLPIRLSRVRPVSCCWSCTWISVVGGCTRFTTFVRNLDILLSQFSRLLRCKKQGWSCWHEYSCWI